MNNNDYKVLITTSGIGSRLGDLTKDLNKVLVDINGQAAISYLFKSHPVDVTFVITLGHLGDQVRNFLLKNFPNINFEFVRVDNYQGPGSSLGYSLLQAKDNLQCPFIYQACDTIVLDSVPKPDKKNWIGGYVTDWAKTDLVLGQYRTHTVENNKIIKLNEKGVSPFNSIHIGLDGIYDYKIFWGALEEVYNADKMNSGLSEVHVLEKMMSNGVDFEWLPFSVWLDTGNLVTLEKTKKYLQNNLK